MVFPKLKWKENKIMLTIRKANRQDMEQVLNMRYATMKAVCGFEKE